MANETKPFVFKGMQGIPGWEDAVGKIYNSEGQYFCEIDDGVSPEAAKKNRKVILSIPYLIDALKYAIANSPVIKESVLDKAQHALRMAGE